MRDESRQRTLHGLRTSSAASTSRRRRARPLGSPPPSPNASRPADAGARRHRERVLGDAHVAVPRVDRRHLRPGIPPRGGRAADVGDAGGHRPCDAIGRIEDGHAPERICVAAEEEDAALIVLGTRGQGASRAALLGSVSLATIRGTSRPVVVVPPATRGRASLDGECLVCGIGGPGDTGPARLAARLARAGHAAHARPRRAAPGRRALGPSTIAAVPLAAPAQPSERTVLQGRRRLRLGVTPRRGRGGSPSASAPRGRACRAWRGCSRDGARRSWD